LPGRLATLQESLARYLDDASLVIEPFREGVDAFVDLVTRPGHAPAIVKSAKVERLLTTYEGLVDYAVIMRREIAVADLLRQANLPAPAVLGWHRSTGPDDPSWILSEYVAHEPTDALSPHVQEQLGQLARTMHAIHPSGDARRWLAPSVAWDEYVVARILARLEAARRYVSLPDDRHLVGALRRTVQGRSPHAGALLHLDLRAPNLAVVGDRIVAILDYGNAIAGDPYFELARIKSFGGLTPAFLSGYGGVDLDRHHALLLAYGLDLTALLTVVTREEFVDESLHTAMAAQTVATTHWLASR